MTDNKTAADASSSSNYHNSSRRARQQLTNNMREQFSLVGRLVLTCGRCSRGRPPAPSWPSSPCSPSWLPPKGSGSLARQKKEELPEKEGEEEIKLSEKTIGDRQHIIPGTSSNKVGMMAGGHQTSKPKRILYPLASYELFASPRARRQRHRHANHPPPPSTSGVRPVTCCARGDV